MTRQRQSQKIATNFGSCIHLVSIFQISFPVLRFLLTDSGNAKFEGVWARVSEPHTRLLCDSKDKVAKQPQSFRPRQRIFQSYPSLRFEVIHHATRIARGRDGKTDYDLYRLEVPKDQLSFNSWQEIPLNFDTSMLAEIQMDILQVYYTPKVTADIPWRLDKSIEFPLRVGRLAPESDPFGFVEF